MSAVEPLALSPREAAAYLAVSKRTLSRLIRSNKIAARKAGPRTLVDVASLKAYYQSLPLKTDQAPLVFGERAHIRPPPHRKHSRGIGCHGFCTGVRRRRYPFSELMICNGHVGCAKRRRSRIGE